MTSTKSLEQRMLAAAKKAGRDRDALNAVREYRAEAARVDAKTARLRTLRLAKEAAEAAAAAALPPATRDARRIRSKSPPNTD